MSGTTFEEIAKRTGKSVGDAGNAAAGAVEGSIPAFTQAAQTTADALRATGKGASARLSDLGHRIPEAQAEIVERVQAQPLTAVMLAAAVGLLTGLMLWRR